MPTAEVSPLRAQKKRAGDRRVGSVSRFAGASKGSAGNHFLRSVKAFFTDAPLAYLNSIWIGLGPALKGI